MLLQSQQVLLLKHTLFWDLFPSERRHKQIEQSGQNNMGQDVTEQNGAERGEAGLDGRGGTQKKAEHRALLLFSLTSGGLT